MREVAALAILPVALADISFGQTPVGKLPLSSRTVYKCEVSGKISYSDEPCLGAKKMDIEPTRGLDSSSGKARTGHDVQRERFHEDLDEAIKPLTGKGTKEMDVERRRIKLTPQAKLECRRLDVEVASLEQQEREVTKDRSSIQLRLYERRLRIRQLGC